MRRLAVVSAALVTALSVTGCADYKGINSLPLPGTVGTDSDSYQVTMVLQNAVNMVPNTPVLINDMTVGTVTKVALEGWTPVLTLSLRKDVTLPANATASLGQTSLLGSKHVALAAPTDQPAQGVLRPGARIPEERSKRFPQTEEVLAGVSLLLNGGGLQHVQTITTELNRALGGGRDREARELLTGIDRFATGMDEQRQDIITAMKGLDRLSGTLAPRMNDIQRALQDLPAGLKVIDEQEPRLVAALGSLSKAEDEFKVFHAQGVDSLGDVLSDLRPVLRRVGDVQNGSTMKALKQIPFVTFPLDSIPRAFRGDWVRIFLTLDLTNEALDQAFLTGTPAGGLLASATKLQTGKLPSPLSGTQAGPPLKLPLGGPGVPKVPAPPPPPVGEPLGNTSGNPVPRLGG